MIPFISRSFNRPGVADKEKKGYKTTKSVSNSKSITLHDLENGDSPYMYHQDTKERYYQIAQR